MTFLLDTNAWVTHLRTGGQSRVTQRLRATPLADLATCSVVRAELMVGALKGPNPAVDVPQLTGLLNPLISFPFNDHAADAYAEIRAGLERKGAPIGAYDYMIAATARTWDLTLVTHNTREFSRVPHLQIEDWQ